MRVLGYTHKKYSSYCVIMLHVKYLQKITMINLFHFKTKIPRKTGQEITILSNSPNHNYVTIKKTCMFENQCVGPT